MCLAPKAQHIRRDSDPGRIRRGEPGGIAPGIQITVQISAESALQSGRWIELVRKVNRAFSAGAFGVL